MVVIYSVSAGLSIGILNYFAAFLAAAISLSLMTQALAASCFSSCVMLSLRTVHSRQVIVVLVVFISLLSLVLLLFVMLMLYRVSAGLSIAL